MDISSRQQNCSFKSVNLIQVPKKAFKHPNDAIKVSKDFIKASNKATGEIHPILSQILSLFGFGKKANKTLTYLEQPGYVEVEKANQKYGAETVDAISRKTNISNAKPLMSDYHTFVVLTKEHKDQATPLASAKGNISMIAKMAKEGAELRANNKLEPSEQAPWVALKSNQILSEHMNNIMKDADIKTFQVKDLSELPKTFNKIDY